MERHYYTANDVILSEEEATKILVSDLEVDIIEPSSSSRKFVLALEAFAHFVLFTEREQCRMILDNAHAGVGVLQGGNNKEEIYRVIINDDEHGGCNELLRTFRTTVEGKMLSHLLTMDKLEEYMIGMCDRRSSLRSTRRCTRVNNLMYILTFGETGGQIRHIDAMNPNLQICLYMSNDCPSTVIYQIEGEGQDIVNGEQLVAYWESNNTGSVVVPDLIKCMLLHVNASKRLSEQRHTRYFTFWGSINDNLFTFGKLYQKVSSSVAFNANPGETLIAGGNEVHAGPKTVGPRMFAFAVGIPEEDDDDDVEIASDSNSRNMNANSTTNADQSPGDDEDANGEIQYCPALLHVDLTCILFITMEIDFADRIVEHEGAKRFMLEVLMPFIEDEPQETYERLLSDERSDLREWLGRVARAKRQGDSHDINAFILEGMHSDTIFFSPDFKSSKHNKVSKRRRARRRNKKTES